MRDCRLNDPAVLAAWLDGTLDPESRDEIDRHLTEGCQVCWSVLRFVDRLRELVGDAADRSTAAAARLAVILDSDALRTAMGLPRQGALSRELVLDLGPWQAALRIRGEPEDAARVLELQTSPGESTPAPGSVRLEVLRGERVLARGRTDEEGWLRLPLDGDGPFRLSIRGPGVRPVSVPVNL